MNLNKAFVIGRTTANPELRVTQTGNKVANFSIATNRVWFDKSGGKKEETEFHNIVVWGRQAEVASQFLTKGSLVMIEGRLQTRSWDDRDGRKQRTTEIIAERIQLGPRSMKSQKESAENASQEQKTEEMPSIDLEGDEIKPEDLPF